MYIHIFIQSITKVFIGIYIRASWRRPFHQGELCAALLDPDSCTGSYEKSRCLLVQSLKQIHCPLPHLFA